MPGDCKYYNEEVEHITSRTVGISHPDGGGITTVTLRWCEHADSPCDYEETRLLGGAQRLKCGGDLEKCPIDYDGS